VCVGSADIELTFTLHGQKVPVAVCYPCAVAILSRYGPRRPMFS
jgi:hypothetical protein